MAENEAPSSLSHDPYKQTAAAVVDPPSSFGQALRQIGPGLILTASIVGTGELIATTNLGATVGFVLLWLVIVSCVIKVFVQIELGRYSISSGKTTLESFKNVPAIGGALCWWWFVMMLLTQLQIGAMVGGVAYTFHMALPLFRNLLKDPEVPWAIVVSILTAALLLRGTYRMVERITTVLVALFTLITVICVVLLFGTDYAFSLSDIGSGLTFQIPIESAALIAALAMIGITGVGASELIAYPYWCIEKGYARNVGPRDESQAWEKRAKGWMGVLRLDSWTSMVIYTLATIAFFLLGASVLNRNKLDAAKATSIIGLAAAPHGDGAISATAIVAHSKTGLPDNTKGLLGELTRMYEPVLGSTGATWFVAIGGFVVLFSTLFAATAANSRTTTDFLVVQGLIHVKQHKDRRRWIRIFSVFFPTFGMILYLFFKSPVLMVVVGGVAQALTLPMIAGVAIYLRYRRTDRRLKPTHAWTFFLWLSLAGFVIAAAWGLKTQFDKLMN